eukprot:4418995-Prymnesium_polylepis.2
MRNHGVLTVGKTVGEAWVRHYYLDRVCRIQVALGSRPAVEPPKAVLEHAAAQYDDGSAFQHGMMEWASLKRQAARLASERKLRGVHTPSLGSDRGGRVPVRLRACGSRCARTGCNYETRPFVANCCELQDVCVCAHVNTRLDHFAVYTYAHGRSCDGPIRN